jgi:chromosomal replication initiation ATPase DnaA
MTKITEALIRTPSIDEAVAHIELFLHSADPGRLLVVGPEGSGKTFLAAWAREQTRNGKRGAICDNVPPPADLPHWIWMVRSIPSRELIRDAVVVHIHPAEFERKAGVLQEWAAVRHLRFEPQALETLLRVDTGNLQRLRSLADRAARESQSPSPIIREIDVLRTLARLGYLVRPPHSDFRW